MSSFSFFKIKGKDKSEILSLRMITGQGEEGDQMNELKEVMKEE